VESERIQIAAAQRNRRKVVYYIALGMDGASAYRDINREIWIIPPVTVAYYNFSCWFPFIAPLWHKAWKFKKNKPQFRPNPGLKLVDQACEVLRGTI
jgi:hypothetical protein